MRQQMEALPVVGDNTVGAVNVEYAAEAKRMLGVTGFVTILWRAPDFRPLAFSRYYHVRRVAWLAQYIAQRRSASGFNLDKKLISLLSWGHDLNRWPFAHNSEKGVFDQGSDMPRFFTENGLHASNTLLVDLQNIVDKKHAELSEEGKVVLLADIVAGFIEDPLWAVAALDLHPRIVPADVARYLCIPLADATFIRRLYDLSILFFQTRTVEPFKSEFDALFQEIAIRFFDSHDLTTICPLGSPSFEASRHMIKEEFMRGRLFPYNNERVSMGPRLRNDIVEPLLSAFGADSVRRLTVLDDAQALDAAIALGAISPHARFEYLPQLDYVAEHEPDASFRQHYKG